MRHLRVLLLFLLTLATIQMMAQRTIVLRQHKLQPDQVPPANYSGICRISGDTYALVSDQEKEDGFYLMSISMDSEAGKITDARRIGYRSSPSKKVDKSGMSVRDLEGIAYHPSTSTFFLGGEGDEEVLEYDSLGRPTGRRLDMPQAFNVENIRVNLGIESLTYNKETHRFWTTTESTLKSDGEMADANHSTVRNRLRLLSFNDNLKCDRQFAYIMEAPLCANKGKHPKTLIHGVSDLCALDDGRLVVMEREIYVSKKNLNNYVNVRLFMVDPSTSQSVDEGTPLSQQPASVFMQKTELCAFKTKGNITRRNIANYEGMCMGPKLNDGRQTLLLINDTQNGMTKHGIRLKEYIKVIILE
ncbi:MAG: esterase-like activity of phytase family protein [Bacteroidaceae bacterium]|nr:esterase-like activity of phytase family protein [Bacteroidaceae bacterium]